MFPGYDVSSYLPCTGNEDYAYLFVEALSVSDSDDGRIPFVYRCAPMSMIADHK